MNTDRPQTDPIQRMQGPEAESTSVPKSKRKSPVEKYDSLPEAMRVKVRELIMTGVTKVPPFRLNGEYVYCDHPDLGFSSLGPLQIVRQIVEKDLRPPTVITLRPPTDTPPKGPNGRLQGLMPVVVVGVVLVSWCCLFQAAMAPWKRSPGSNLCFPSECSVTRNALIGSEKQANTSKPFSVSGNSLQLPTSSTSKFDSERTALKGNPERFPTLGKRIAQGTSAPVPPGGGPDSISALWKSISELHSNKIHRSVDLSGNRSETISESLGMWAEYREALPQLLPSRWTENWRAEYWPVGQSVPWSTPLSVPIVPAEEFEEVTEVIHTIGADGQDALLFRSRHPERLWAAVQVLGTGMWRPGLDEFSSRRWLYQRRAEGVVISQKP